MKNVRRFLTLISLIVLLLLSVLVLANCGKTQTATDQNSTDTHNAADLGTDSEGAGPTVAPRVNTPPFPPPAY